MRTPVSLWVTFSGSTSCSQGGMSYSTLYEDFCIKDFAKDSMGGQYLGFSEGVSLTGRYFTLSVKGNTLGK